MIVQSMRLKNIKSYGEGPDGEGVTISFEPGANRIAGKNGHGKTTLIESLGYALFLTGPIFEEGFQLETYLLRAGQKAAEIDVTFSHRGELYRIERGLGPFSKRKTKVVQIEDGSTCAEGEKEVSTFLCRLFGLPNPRRFSELFWKLIGVRQGRLTWPFDSKPSAAKEFFEPLLDVAVFRECFQSLKPAVDEFMARFHEQETVRAAVEERIRERADSAAVLKIKRLQFLDSEQRLQLLNEAGVNTSRRLAQLEATEAALRTAELNRRAAQNELELGRQQTEVTAQRLRESVEAAEVIDSVVSGYNSFEQAEKDLHTLRTKLAEQRRLETEISDAEKKKIESDGKLNGARSQTEIFARQKQDKELERLALRARVETLRSSLRDSQPEFERRKDLAKRAAHSLSDLRHFVGSFAILLLHGDEILKRLKTASITLAANEPAAWQTIRDRVKNLDERRQAVFQQLAAAKAQHATLLKQLQEIGDGICPFLKEQCRQFDPSKVEVDLQEQRAVIEVLRMNQEGADSALRAAQIEQEERRQEEQSRARLRSQIEQMIIDFSAAFGRLEWARIREHANNLRGWTPEVAPVPEPANWRAEGARTEAFERMHQQNIEYLHQLENWWPTTEATVQKRINVVLQEDERRNSDLRDEINSLDHLHRIGSEIEKLGVAETEQREAAFASERDSAKLQRMITELGQRRLGFGFLADQIRSRELTQQTYRSDYQRYLGARPLAEKRSSREIELRVRREQEEGALAKLRHCEGTLSELLRGFDESDLASTRREAERIIAACAAESHNLEIAKRDLEREEVRFREWQEACGTRDEILRIQQRLSAAVKLTELARVVLRDAAPMVAQQLCDRIAAQAQRIFNRINHDPVELRWEAAPRYSLRVTPGDRRFAMLSGGEQTKLALAMTLAMIQEFSGLRFCIFDEPTYGVDSESREKLGDALLESQKTAELEQLILVSHDDAFDGKIEHAIFLRKTAASGTEVVQFPGQLNRQGRRNSIASGA